MLTTLAQVIANIVADTLVLGVLALGMGIRVRSAQVYDFSYFAMFALGAYLSWALATLGIPFLVSVCVALGTVSLLALLIDLVILRNPLSRNRRLEAMIASLGLFVVVENAISLIAGPETQVLAETPLEVYDLQWLPGAPILNSHQIFAIAASLLVMSVVTAFVISSEWGIRFRATDDNRDLAFALGLRPWRLVSEAQVLCAILAATAGILYALDRDLTPEMALRPMLHVTVAIVLGGLGMLLGPVVGLFAVTTTWHLTGLYFDTQWQDMSVFLLLLIVLLVTPQGLSRTFTGSLRDT
ncbi:branched-chain amino acid ABC transporter permease [Candidatus Thiosymbion oneisti]|uniref:branched-chain amino acid ABC transporter permease n=1 Tax=Candidatus Thiosymbion oneisti TaxID=589554 RepID=UPI000B7D9A7E|nr:hypothetical protein [Candidatus Thiosymbion oneisti]